MKKTFYIAILATAVLAAPSCSREDTVSEKAEGTVSLGVDIPLTRAAMTSDELLSNASVKIYMADFSGLVRSYRYSETPEKIYLPENEYRVDVTAGEAAKESPAAASWEQKSYFGSKAFTVTAGANSSVQVEAKVSNAISRITFDPTVAENFNSGYSFSIGLDADTQLVYDESKSGKEGYFIISGLDEPEFVWTFTGNLAKDGSAFVRTGRISGIESAKVYAMTAKYTIKDGDVGFELLVDYSTEVKDDTIIFEPVSTGLSDSAVHEIWAHFATVHADVDETEFPDPSAVKFAYRSVGSDSWTSADAVRSSEGVYDATITGLSGATSYEYKLVIGGADQGDSKTFTTDADPNVPNASFEYVSKVSGKNFYKWYDPSCSVEEGKTAFWGSGNGDESVSGSGGMGFVITEPSSDAKDGSRSVCAQSQNAVIKLAAGNIFTGQFAGLVGTSGGKVNFGRPWTSRPTGIRLWVKYTTGTIDKIESLPSGVTLSKSDYDRANVKIALGTWDYRKYGGTQASPVQVNTTNSSTFVNYATDASTIADAELVLYGDGYQQINLGTTAGAKTSAATSSWRQVTIPLNYHRTTEFPTHIIISCASSMYGDYFTGCTSSKLWIDGIELLYDKL